MGYNGKTSFRHRYRTNYKLNRENIVTEEKKKVLVAEDTESNYLLVSYILRAEYNVVWAHDGVEALEMFDEEKPDIVLMDIRMPRLGGLAATARIREKDKNVPIIALTAFAFDSDRAQAIDAGCNDFIAKPLSAEVLREKIKYYLNK